MTTKPFVSTNKIIMLLVFICAAILTSLFVYRISHQQPSSALPPDQGTLFAAPRDIKPFELVSADGKPFTLDNFRGRWSLVFFGFTHCSMICPTTMDLLKRVYPELHAAYPNLQVVFISLDPERDSPEKLSSYTQSYNKDFIGVSGKMTELRKLQSQLGIYSARDNSADDSKNYQLQHTASILLINPEGKWSALYKFGLTPEEFVQAVKKSVKP